MRSIWKGSVSFGLVTIPVKLYTATEERDISFHQVRRSDGSRIRYRRVAEADGQEVAYADIAKGYQLPDGDVVVLTDEDFADLPLSTTRAVDVLQFVPMDQLDPIYFAKSYYLEPEKTATKAYVLLRDALAASGMVGVVKVALRSREQLAALRVRDDVLVMETMLWPDEVRTPDFGFLDDDVATRPQEMQMAESLIESMSGDFDPTQYSDEYRQALQEVIDAKVEGREVIEAAEETTSKPGNVVDLMAALRASVDAAKRSRGEDVPSAAADPSDGASAEDADAAPAATSAPKAAPAKRAPAKKAPAKTAAAKTAPAKKAAAASAPRKAAAKAAPAAAEKPARRRSA